VKEIPVTRIRPNPRQPRRSFPEAELEELASSIKSHGVLQPLLLKAVEGGYELVSGERRLRAAKMAGLQAVPAIMVDPAETTGSLTIALVENVQREDLNSIELARAYKQLQDEFGRTQEEIATAVGKSRPHVANTLRLLELDKSIQAALEDGKITAGHARALLMAPPETRNLIFRRMLSEGISVRQAEEAARARSEKRDNGEKPKKSAKAQEDPDVADMLRRMERAIESRLGRKTHIDRGRRGRGRVSIEFVSDDDLRGLVETLSGN
jgi:ParB family chromosome partitioning protein